MKNEILLLDMFTHYAPPETLASALSQAVVLAADIDPEARRIRVDVFSTIYISQSAIDQFCSDIARIYGLHSMTVYAKHPSDQLGCMLPSDMMALFVGIDSMTRGSLAGAKWRFEDHTLIIDLRANGKDIVEKCVPEVCRTLADKFGVNVEIQVNADAIMEGQNLFEMMAKMRQSALEELPKHTPVEKKTKAPEDESVIFGKAIKGKITPMDQVTLELGYAIIEGKVFAINHKEIPRLNAWIVNMDVTDNTSTVRVSRYLENKKAQPILKDIKVGDYIRVQGKMQIDTYANETVLNPSSIVKAEKPVRKDKAEGAKRVELHLHTVMSNMDALTNTKAAIKQAAAWGHRAIAITDHGCVQSFTDALHVVEDWSGAPKVAGTDEDIKILYGCEGYYINDVNDKVVVKGSADMLFDAPFVAFDLETTGLSAYTDKIIEIGAVLMQGGKELDRFQTFVDPGCRLRKEIVELTGITDDMLNGAPTIEEVLPKFLDFVGDRILVAHNADFDTGFIRAACEQLGYAYRLTSADTLVLSQNLMTELNRFKLDIVADALSLPEFNHHRAADDAVICGLIMCNFMKRLEEMDVHSLQQINRAMESMRSQHRADSRNAQHIVLIAKNQMGLRNLYRLISEANLYHFKRVPRIFKSELIKYREGLIIGSACENNELFQAVIKGASDDELKRIAAFYDYLEIQPVDNNRFMLTKMEGGAPIAKSEEQLRDFNRTIVRIGAEMGKMVVATGDVHFLNPEDEIFRHILLTTKGFEDGDKSNPLYLRTTDEMLTEFAYLGEEKAMEVVVTNPNIIVDMCDTVRPVPHNLFAPSIENSVEDLKKLVYGKLHRLYGENPPELITKRVETELNDIISSHYDVIYMSAQKLVQNSLENGYLVGSRGSVGSSIVAYLSGITEVNSFPPHYRCPNPECKYTTFDVPEGYGCGADLPDANCPECGAVLEKDGFNIPFETFLGFGGDKIPDIDLNFSGEYQARAHAYCTEMFGSLMFSVQVP